MNLFSSHSTQPRKFKTEGSQLRDAYRTGECSSRGERPA